MKNILVTGAVAAFLAACGGGGSSDSAKGGVTTAADSGSTGQCVDGATTQSAEIQGACSGHGGLATAEGVYFGSTSTGRTTTALVLDDGTYYVIYSSQNNPSIIAGAVTGTGTSLNGILSSSNAKDINLEELGLLPTSFRASYSYKQSLYGAINYPSLNQTVTFTGTYNSAYQLSPALSTIAGTYSGRVGHTRGAEPATVTVSSSGAISGQGTSGCAVTGSLTPRSKGNIYTTTVTFGGSPCVFPNTTLTGASYYDATAKRLYVIGMTSTRDNGMIFGGSKP